MRFLLLMFPGPSAYTRQPTEADFAPMMKFNEELAKAGVLLSLDGLHGPSEAVRVRYPAGKPIVSDGPFSEAKEVIGGFWILQVKSKAEAIEWARRVPASPDDFVEVREIQELADFDLSPELTKQAKSIEQQIAKS